MGRGARAVGGLSQEPVARDVAATSAARRVGLTVASARVVHVGANVLCPRARTGRRPGGGVTGLFRDAAQSLGREVRLGDMAGSRSLPASPRRGRRRRSAPPVHGDSHPGTSLDVPRSAAGRLGGTPHRAGGMGSSVPGGLQPRPGRRLRLGRPRRRWPATEDVRRRAARCVRLARTFQGAAYAAFLAPERPEVRSRLEARIAWLEGACERRIRRPPSGRADTVSVRRAN